jgi:hypothetical protein
MKKDVDVRATTKVLPCDCHHPFQEKRYGQHHRLHNMCHPKNDPPDWRCTVCGKVKAS